MAVACDWFEGKSAAKTEDHGDAIERMLLVTEKGQQPEWMLEGV